MSSETCFCGCTLGRGALAIGTINAVRKLYIYVCMIIKLCETITLLKI